MSHHVVGYVPTCQRHLLKRMNGATCSNNLKLMIVIRPPSGNLGLTLGGVLLTAHLKQLPRLRMSAAIHLLLLYVFMTWTGTNSNLPVSF
jgi:hypothetical protein